MKKRGGQLGGSHGRKADRWRASIRSPLGWGSTEAHWVHSGGGRRNPWDWPQAGIRGEGQHKCALKAARGCDEGRGVHPAGGYTTLTDVASTELTELAGPGCSGTAAAPNSAPFRAARSAAVWLILWPWEEERCACASSALPALVMALLRPAGGGGEEGEVHQDGFYPDS